MRPPPIITQIDQQSEAQNLGVHLRKLRRKLNWTLKDFEKASAGAIKDVVLGSYERGSRSISVANLRIITDVYEIPIGTLFPNEYKKIAPQQGRKMIIDLRKLRVVMDISQSKTLEITNKFANGILRIREDWYGEVLSIRSEDLNLLAIMTSLNLEEFLAECSNSNIMVESKD